MSFWNDRYATPEYVYGVAPNRWLEAQAAKIRPGGRVTSLGEGEGRNAVWLAQHGFEVDAVDASEVDLAKARQLAEARGARIRTHVEHLGTYSPAAKSYDALVLIYLHLAPTYRSTVHAAGSAALRDGGVVILEAFTPRQLQLSSGGPKKPDVLYDPGLLRADFPDVEWEVLEEVAIDLDEGAFHQGRAAVVRGVGRARRQR